MICLSVISWISVVYFCLALSLTLGLFFGPFRYVPVRKSGKPLGIIMLLDRTPDEPEDVALVEAPSTDPDGEEADPPEPFEWTPGGVGKPIPATES